MNQWEQPSPGKVFQLFWILVQHVIEGRSSWRVGFDDVDDQVFGSGLHSLSSEGSWQAENGGWDNESRFTGRSTARV